MSFKSKDFTQSEVMNELERLYVEKNPESIKKEASVKEESVPNDFLSSVIRYSKELKSKGFFKEAASLDEKIAFYVVAETHLYRAIDEDGEDLIDFAHKNDDEDIADAEGDLGKVFDSVKKHKMIVDVVKKQPTGKYASEKTILDEAHEGDVEVATAKDGHGKVETLDSIHKKMVEVATGGVKKKASVTATEWEKFVSGLGHSLNKVYDLVTRNFEITGVGSNYYQDLRYLYFLCNDGSSWSWESIKDRPEIKGKFNSLNDIQMAFYNAIREINEDTRSHIEFWSRLKKDLEKKLNTIGELSNTASQVTGIGNTYFVNLQLLFDEIINSDGFGKINKETKKSYRLNKKEDIVPIFDKAIVDLKKSISQYYSAGTPKKASIDDKLEAITSSLGFSKKAQGLRWSEYRHLKDEEERLKKVLSDLEKQTPRATEAQKMGERRTLFQVQQKLKPMEEALADARKFQEQKEKEEEESKKQKEEAEKAKTNPNTPDGWKHWQNILYHRCLDVSSKLRGIRNDVVAEAALIGGFIAAKENWGLAKTELQNRNLGTFNTVSDLDSVLQRWQVWADSQVKKSSLNINSDSLFKTAGALSDGPPDTPTSGQRVTQQSRPKAPTQATTDAYLARVNKLWTTEDFYKYEHFLVPVSDMQKYLHSFAQWLSTQSEYKDQYRQQIALMLNTSNQQSGQRLFDGLYGNATKKALEAYNTVANGLRLAQVRVPEVVRTSVLLSDKQAQQSIASAAAEINSVLSATNKRFNIQTDVSQQPSDQSQKIKVVEYNGEAVYLSDLQTPDSFHKFMSRLSTIYSEGAMAGEWTSILDAISKQIDIQSQALGRMSEQQRDQAERLYTRAKTLVARLISQVKRAFTAMQDKGADLTPQLIARLNGLPQQSSDVNTYAGRPTQQGQPGRSVDLQEGESGESAVDNYYFPINGIIEPARLNYLDGQIASSLNPAIRVASLAGDYRLVISSVLSGAKIVELNRQAALGKSSLDVTRQYLEDLKIALSNQLQLFVNSPKMERYLRYQSQIDSNINTALITLDRAKRTIEQSSRG